MKLISLNSLPIGKSCCVVSIDIKGAKRHRLQNLGIIAGTKITALHKSPAGDPTAYFIRGAVIALREDDTKNIIVEEVLI